MIGLKTVGRNQLCKFAVVIASRRIQNKDLANSIPARHDTVGVSNLTCMYDERVSHDVHSDHQIIPRPAQY